MRRLVMAKDKMDTENETLAKAKNAASYRSNDSDATSSKTMSTEEPPLQVSLAPSIPDPTDDQGLWAAIRDRTNAISFKQYSNFINRLFCLSDPDQGAPACPDCEGNPAGYGSPSIKEVKDDLLRRPSIYGVNCHQLLKLATQAFLSFEAGVVLTGERNASTGTYNNEPDSGMQGRLENYLKQLGGDHTLPYIEQIASTLISNSSKKENLPYCDALLRNRFTCPSMLELIWSYWQEEGMLVQSMNAIAHRFQNRRLGDKDPLINLELDPIRPLNNLLWGVIQEARSNMSTDINQRSHEYLHHYGISLYGRAVKSANPADKRSNFIPAFHAMLQRADLYYKQAANKTITADAFPLLQAIKDVHLILAEGAHNQFGDLPWTTRAEMLMMQWLLSRRELREFLRGRHMVLYPEPWMGTVDAMKRAQGWNEDTVTHFRELAIFGEQIVLSVRWGNWGAVNNEINARNWAEYWKAEIQSYIHSYHRVTEVDLSLDNPDTKQIQLRNMQPSVHLQKRLTAQQRTKGSQLPPSTASGKASPKKPATQAEVMSLF